VSEFINTLLANPIVVLFAILAIGTVVGQLSWRNISLGNSAILFVALVFGHYGFTLPPEISALGVVLFVYAVGLQAGPRFFKSFRQRGLSYAVLAIATLVSGVATAILIGALMGIDGALAAGLFTGAKTTTPGLAAALEATGKNPLVSVGYGIAYPFGVLGVVLFAQLLPRLLGIDLVKEGGGAVAGGPQGRSSLAGSSQSPAFRAHGGGARQRRHRGWQHCPVGEEWGGSARSRQHRDPTRRLPEGGRPGGSSGRL
jgi:AspT/YidE/YbjL antiporter-like protein